MASSLEQMEDGANVRALKEGMRYEIMGRKKKSSLKDALYHKVTCYIDFSFFVRLRLVVEARLLGIKNVMALQTMMRLLGNDAPKDLKWKLEVSFDLIWHSVSLFLNILHIYD